MLDKFKKISNPLTVIAIFAAIAELSGTVVLTRLESETQQIFVWFVMGFPVLLVCLFFAILNWNNKVLYAPSDFKEDIAFLETIKKLSPEEQQVKISQRTIQDFGSSASSTEGKAWRQKTLAAAMLAKDIALSQMEAEFDTPMYRNVQWEGENYITFDGFAVVDSKAIVFQVIFSERGNLKSKHLGKMLKEAESFQKAAKEAECKAEVVFVIVLNIPDSKKEKGTKKSTSCIKALTKGLSLNLKIRVFHFDTLMMQSGLKDFL